LNNLKIEKAKELINYLDVLIDGEYDYKEPEDRRRWIGSKNQKIYFFTDRYTMKDFDNKIDEIEVHYQNDKIFINGFPME